MELSIKIWEKNGEYVANCPELDIFCYGINYKQAQDRIKKVILFYAETAHDLGYNINPKELISSLDTNLPKRTGSYAN